jgi:hypothetical protein
MNFIKYILSNILLFLIIVVSAEAHDRTIKGVIHDKEGKPIASATIRLENTMLGTIANKKGEFILRRIPDGKFKLMITAIGYEPFYHTIEFEHEEGDDMDLDVTMFEAIV